MDAVYAEGAPAAIGPYSQAIVADGWVFVSGQLALDPRTGSLGPGDASAQTERALENLAAILSAAGARLADVVKTTVYLRDLSDFAAMNAVYERRFARPYPARATVQVAALPKGAAVEIDAIARLR